MDAISDWNPDIIDYLLKKNAYIGCDKKGRSPLHHCVLHANQKLIQRLINLGADLACQDENGRTPLHYASSKNLLDICEILVNSGAPVDMPDFDGRTPMHEASKRGNEILVELFYEFGANPFAEDKNGVNLNFSIPQLT